MFEKFIGNNFLNFNGIPSEVHIICAAISFVMVLLFCVASELEESYNDCERKLSRQMSSKVRDLELQLNDCERKLSRQMSSKVRDLELQLNDCERKLSGQISSANKRAEYAENRSEISEKVASKYKASLVEKAKGFPSIISAIDEIEAFYDNKDAISLSSKRRPALKSAELVKLHSKEKREALKKARYFENIVTYYEEIFPDLVDIREQEIELEESDSIVDHTYTEIERQDEVTKMLSRSEYLSLKPVDRNQLALERYWKRHHSPATLGKMYERYVGYLYEQQGYDVEYFGINQKLNDLGVDLICRKNKTILAVQCKNWSKYKSVFENRIFQHFGTTFRLAKENEEYTVTPVFYTTTQLSDNAREFANMLKIKVVENHIFDKNYPCIKCNIGKNGEKIYHLPLDQLYDKVKIETKKGEFYAKTCQEAEEKGFRRAYRWSGKKS